MKRIRHTMYTNIIICFIAILLLLAASLSGLFITNQKQRIEAQLVDKYTTGVQQFKRNVDTYILKMAEDIVLYSLNNNPEVTKLFYVPQDKNIVYILRTYEAINKVVHSNELIHSIYVYYSDNNLIVSSQGTFYLDNRPDLCKKFEGIFKGSLDGKQWKVTDGSLFDELSEKKNPSTLSYIRSVPVKASSEDKNGLFIINVDLEIARNHIAELGMDVFDETMIANRDEDIIYATEGINKQMDVIQAGISGEEGYLKETAKKFIFYSQSDISDFYYLTKVSMNSYLSPFDSQFYIFIFVVMVAVIIIAIVLANFLYTPIRKLTVHSRKINKELLGEESESLKEAVTINKVLNQLVDKVEKLQEVVDFDEPELKRSLLRRLFQNTMKHSEHLNQLTERLNIQMPYTGYACLLVKVEHDHHNVQFDTDKYNLIYYIENICINNCVKMAYENEKGHIGVLVNIANEQALMRFSKDILEYCHDHLGYDSIIGLGCIQSQLMDVNKSYAEAYNVMEYSLIYEETPILYYKEIVANLSEEKMSFKVIDDFNELITKNEHMDTVFAYVEDVFQTLEEGQHHIERIWQILNGFALAVNEPMRRYHGKDVFKWRDCKGLSQVKEELFRSIKGLYDLINIKNHHLVIVEINTVKDYLYEQIYKGCVDDISLVSVSEKFNKSPNYLSKLFKEHAGVSFKEFVIEIKLQRAEELLRQEDKQKISEIAESLGYYNTSYFIKIFKKKYGCTPKQYRSEHRMSQ